MENDYSYSAVLLPQMKKSSTTFQQFIELPLVVRIERKLSQEEYSSWFEFIEDVKDLLKKHDDMPILKSEIVSLLVGIQQNLLNSKAQILAEIQKSHSISTYHDLKDKTESCCTSEKTRYQ
eukprot:TRINITY_DN2635_c0_g1_i2.p1 TRINITY_DN2635_c0_g1~~TRINITY_DN2635_c0_g1_i2.p1  ORF type:complete len:138 (-),score=33.38 TRINITY_DN2635_c0_g1_i2:29-391(-)